MDTHVPPTDNPQMLGDQLYAQGNFSEAAEAYRQATVKSPGSAFAWKSLGLSLIALKQFDEAIETSKKATELQPGNADVRYAHGYALGASGRYSEAIKELDAALYLQPNHIPAKQALVYSLIQVGKQTIQDDPYEAEKSFDRAHKLDQKNPNVIVDLLELYLFMGQKGKAVSLIKELKDPIKADPGVQAAIAKLEGNAEFKVALQQTAVQQAASTAPAAQVKPDDQQAIKQIPCPNCRQLVMDYAAICPYCNFQLRQYGTFAGRDTGPSTTWQEVTYYIASVLWVLNAAWVIISGLMIPIEGVKAFVVTIGTANAGVGIGLLFRTEWLQLVAKILCYINLFWGAYGIMIGFFAGKPIDGVIALVQTALAGLMVYLINYMDG